MSDIHIATIQIVVIAKDPATAAREIDAYLEDKIAEYQSSIIDYAFLKLGAQPLLPIALATTDEEYHRGDAFNQQTVGWSF